MKDTVVFQQTQTLNCKALSLNTSWNMWKNDFGAIYQCAFKIIVTVVNIAV